MEPIGLTAVLGRIAEIQQRTRPPVTGVVAPGRFAAVLARAEQAAAPISHPHAGAPVELAAFGNGRIPPAALVPIGASGHRLWGPAARAYEAMAAGAARDGVVLRVTDSYRSYDAQVDVAGRKGLYEDGGLAARPGTSSHGWGLSLDVEQSGGALGWLRRRGAEYGFAEDVPREPWHWTYQAGAG